VVFFTDIMLKKRVTLQLTKIINIKLRSGLGLHGFNRNTSVIFGQSTNMTELLRLTGVISRRSVNLTSFHGFVSTSIFISQATFFCDRSLAWFNGHNISSYVFVCVKCNH